MIGHLIHLLKQKAQSVNGAKGRGGGDGGSGSGSACINEEFLYHDCGTDEGMCLLAFFKYYGQQRNFNESTVLRVPGTGAEAAFDRTNLVRLCQEMFGKAYKILLVAISEGPARALAMEKGRGGSRKCAPSVSLLGLLLVNVEDFVKMRSRRGLRCRQAGPLLSDVEKDTKGRAVLFELQQWQHKIQASAAAVDARVTHEDVKRIDPFLWERIRAFPSSSAVVQHLKTQLQRATAQVAKVQRKEKVAARIAACMGESDIAERGGRQGAKKKGGSQKRSTRRHFDPHDFKDEYSGQSHQSPRKAKEKGISSDVQHQKKKVKVKVKHSKEMLKKIRKHNKKQQQDSRREKQKALKAKSKS
mmetsp:Transcript_22014/g.40993  ORF Transcript_22014/g.40993 Transcript_22014/m.40993 type:complete len:358 (+) Transcript_22014:118-1191(+)